MLGGKNIEEGFGIAYRVIQVSSYDTVVTHWIFVSFTFDFFFNVMQDFQLEALALYIRVGQRLVRQRQYSSVRQLLKCVGESGTASKHDCDAIVLSCVSVADKSPADVSSQTNDLFLDLRYCV